MCPAYILYDVIRQIDLRQVEQIQCHYQLKMAAGQRLADINSDIFNNILSLLKDIQQQELLSAVRVQTAKTSLASMSEQPAAAVSAAVVPPPVALPPSVQ